jgi:hypothetical protein
MSYLDFQKFWGRYKQKGQKEKKERKEVVGESEWERGNIIWWNQVQWGFTPEESGFQFLF